MVSKKSNVKTQKNNSLIDYLCSDALMEKHYLTENKNIEFHWSFWDKGCDFQIEKFSNKSDRNEKLEELEKYFQELKNKTVFVRKQVTTLKFSLYDFYMLYVDPLKAQEWDDLKETSQVSMVGEAGPYVAIDSMRWFDREIYSAFIFRKLIFGEMPKRRFRLGVNIPVVCEFDESPLKNEQISLYQLSLSGCLFKVSGGHIFNKFMNAKSVEVRFNLNPFINVLGISAVEAIDYFSKIDFNIINEKDLSTFSFPLECLEDYGNLENAKNGNGKEFFFFLRYEDLKSTNKNVDISDILQSFVNCFEVHFDEELDKKFLNKDHSQAA